MSRASKFKETVARSRALASTSYGVLKRDRFLMAFPAINLACSAAIVGIIGGIVWLVNNGLTAGTTDEAGRWAGEPITWVGLAATCLLVAFSSTYFAVALTFGAWESLQGKNPTFAGCLSAANARLNVIWPWALVAGTVSFIFQILTRLPRMLYESRDGTRNIPVIGIYIYVAALVGVLLVGSLWFLVTYLVVPILVVEQTGPVASGKRSYGLFRKTWGKSAVAEIGFGLIAFFILLPGLFAIGIVAAILTAASGGAAAGPILVAGVVAAVAWMILVEVAMYAISGVFRMALYLYVATGEVPPVFEGTGLEESFSRRLSRKEKKAARRTVRENSIDEWMDA